VATIALSEIIFSAADLTASEMPKEFHWHRRSLTSQLSSFMKSLFCDKINEKLELFLISSTSKYQF